MERAHFRRAEEKDIIKVSQLIGEAKAFLKEQGVDQWQNGYPNRASVEQDVQSNEGYLLQEGDEIFAYACISFNGEPCYNDLEGSWLSQQPYAVIHRMVVANQKKGRGIAHRFFAFAEGLCRENNVFSIKVDTDADNKIMQALLIKNGFTYCGTVCFDNSEKIAFEKLLTC